ncbi:hypothetical protein PPERSA_05132 [Pseudocohnilembus persalinus]|uniref:Uncharacterized protein n=1 Tax=Pseudocohnilembus persalinus TaxID=266149 RepID=A0A0V0QW95_PSEPJ|nr:hypothetical protein PPERSA_05132 [Pseudocohnilembus persalinus]|eukprot:KRX06519.1 hypothetical protein PPERSA_05132 [Pseudocohnilembus persalinus]
MDQQEKQQLREIQEKVSSFLHKLENKTDQVDQKIEKIQNLMKDYILKGQKKKAQRYMQELKLFQQQLMLLENQKIFFVKLSVQLETLESDKQIVSALKNANQYLKSQEKVKEELQDQLLDFHEYLQTKEEADQIWGDLANMGQDKEELQDEFAKYEAQLLQGQMDQINKPMIDQQTVEKEKKIKEMEIQANQKMQQKYVPREKDQDFFEKAIDNMLV